MAAPAWHLQLVETAQAMLRFGLVTLTAGNVSVRDPEGDRFLITPSAVPYEALTPADLVMCRLDGTVIAGSRPPSSEWPLHSLLLRSRPDVGAVVHTHSPYALALAAAGRPVLAICLEVLQCGGPSIEVADWATPGTSALGEAALRQLVGGRRAVLLRNHGLVATGATLAEALATAVQAETAARTHVLASQLGEPIVLTAAELAAMAAYMS